MYWFLLEESAFELLAGIHHFRAGGHLDVRIQNRAELTAEWTYSNVLIDIYAGDRWCVAKPSSGWVVSSSRLLSTGIHSRLVSASRNLLTPIVCSVCSCKAMDCRNLRPADWIDPDTLIGFAVCIRSLDRLLASLSMPQVKYTKLGGSCKGCRAL